MTNFCSVYFMDFSKLINNMEMLNLVSNKLDDDTKNRLSSITSTQRRAEIISGKLLLDSVLKKLFNITEYTIEYNKFGKPQIKDRIDIKYNISHSKNVVALVISDVDCGIDIESLDNHTNAKKLSKRFFSKDECDEISNSFNPNLSFLKYWTIRESYIKMVGMGFSIKPTNLAVLKKDEDYIIVDDGMINDCCLIQVENDINLMAYVSLKEKRIINSCIEKSPD